MTIYDRNERRHWRYSLRRWQRIINAWLAAVTVAVLVLAATGVASAAPRCPGGVCTGQPDRLTVCGWPVRVAGGNVAYCLRYAVEVQP